MLSLSVFVCLSQCVRGFTAEWQRCGSSALTMRQSGVPSGFSAFSHQPVCLTGPNQSGTLHAVCMCFSVACVRASLRAVVLRCVSAYNKNPLCQTRAHNAVWQLFSLRTVAPRRSICASDLIPPINKGAALSNRQRKKKQSLRVAFGRTINGSHPIYQTEHLYVCLSVCV